MDQPEDSEKATAIVPAYNEGPRIGSILEILSSNSLIDQVIVVDDGSSDDTAERVEQYHVQYVRNDENRGKGFSMNRGVELASNDIIFFCDADITGLSHGIVEEIIRPVIHGEIDMFIGMRNRKWYAVHRIISFVPLLGGERALKKSLWQQVPDHYKHCFRIETALNFYALYYGSGFRYKVFKQLSQVIKEHKYGLWDGLRQRCSMIGQILAAQLKLQFIQIPDSAKNGRLLAVISLQSLIGIILGTMVLVAAYYGPSRFLAMLFSHELREDASAPVVHYLLNMANVTATSTITAIGVIILLPNIFTFILTFKKLGFLLYGLKYKMQNSKP